MNRLIAIIQKNIYNFWKKTGDKCFNIIQNPLKKIYITQSVNVNTKEYWNKRFATTDWEKSKGCYQTIENVKASLKKIPKNIVDNIKDNKYSIVDFGCALGDGSLVLKEKFQNNKICGIDFSESAIEIADSRYKQKYNIDFIACDLLKENYNFDVLYSSNVFEHFPDPFERMNILTKRINKYFIVVVPYNEKLITGKTEHVFSFNENNIPESLDNGFKLVYKKAYKIWDSLSPDDCLFYKKLNYSQFIFVYSKQ